MHESHEESMRIPIIDFENHSTDQISSAIDAACRDTGFFVLLGHGIDQHLIDNTFEHAKTFFRLSNEKKMALWTDNQVDDRGYFPSGLQSLDPGKPHDLSEFVMLGLDLPNNHPMVEAKVPMHGPNPWPSDLPGWKDVMNAYHQATKDLGDRLLRIVAQNLDLPESYFEPFSQLPIVTLKLAWYPHRPADALDAQQGAGAHTDWGALSFVANQGSPGLQVLTSDREWLDVPAIENSLVVNIGDMLQRWTNDTYCSATHRVVSTSVRERFSLVTFYDMDYHAPLECISSCVTRDKPAKYSPMLAGEYLMYRYEESLKDVE